MSRFKKKKAQGSTTISTASLPDIVFMLLFFFMVSTTLRETSLKVQVVTPSASEVQKLEKKSLVSYIYVGSPIKSLQGQFGTTARIQLNDAFARKEEVQEFVQLERDKISEDRKNKITFSLRADVDVKMGIITDVKQELRKANALKLNYSTKKRAALDAGS